jgi:hypothetical protein
MHDSLWTQHSANLPENTLVFSFSNLGDRLFYFELANTWDSGSTAANPSLPVGDDALGSSAKSTVQTIMERSLRETKMRKSAGLGELHQ